MIDKNKQNNSNKIFSILIIFLITAWLPLKADGNNDSKALSLKKEMDYTVVVDQGITPLEKPSIAASSIYEIPKNPKTYDFSFEPIRINKPETKYPQTYQSIQDFQKSHGFEKSLFEASLITNLALNAADYFTTKEALQYEGLKEGNPLMKPFVKDDITFAAFKIGLSVGNYFVMKKLHKRNKTLGWIVSILSNLALSYVVSSNMAHIHKARNR